MMNENLKTNLILFHLAHHKFYSIHFSHFHFINFADLRNLNYVPSMKESFQFTNLEFTIAFDSIHF